MWHIERESIWAPGASHIIRFLSAVKQRGREKRGPPDICTKMLLPKRAKTVLCSFHRSLLGKSALEVGHFLRRTMSVDDFWGPHSSSRPLCFTADSEPCPDQPVQVAEFEMKPTDADQPRPPSEKTKGQQLKGKIVSEFFTLFQIFHTFFPRTLPSKQRVSAQGEQKRRI